MFMARFVKVRLSFFGQLMKDLDTRAGRSALEDAVVLLCIDIQGLLIDRVSVYGGDRTSEIVAVGEHSIVEVVVDSISRAVN